MPSKNKYNHLLDTSQVNKDVKKRSVKAGTANLISQGLSLGITLIRAAILARLLAPEDYGVFSMVMVIASFALIFKDLGLATATIREKNISHAQVSNLFWINTLVGIVSMLIIILISPLIVWFYNEPRLLTVAITLAISFLFAGMTVQHQALLKRQMMFGKIAIITVVSSLVSSLLGIATAWLFGNYWALVCMQVSLSLFLMIGFWLSAGWLPSLPSKKAETKNLIKVGVDVAGLNAFSTITQQIDKIIIGRISNASALGYYTKGFQIPQLISGQFRMAIFAVALPALSSLQEERERFATYYYKFLNMIVWITMPISAFCFIFAEEIIYVYFGPKWSESVIFMQLFSIKAFIMPAVTTLDQIPLALGFSKRYLYAGMVRSFALLISLLFVAPFYGVLGIAFCVAFSDLMAFIPFVKLCLKKSPVDIKQYFYIVSIPFISSVGLGIIFFYLKTFTETNSVTFKIIYMILFMLLTITLFFINDSLNKKSNLGISKRIFKYLKLGI